MTTLRKVTKRTLLAGLLVVTLLSLAGMAQAKMIPYVEPLDGDWGTFEEPPVLTLEGAYFSGVFGRLGAAGDADVIHMRFDSPVEGEVRVDLLVPVCGDHFADFFPTLALIGPDQDMPEEAWAALPFDLPEGLGAQILEPERPAENDDSPRPLSDWQVWEQDYYQALTITFEVPIPAKYFFAIWDETGDTGAYTLLTGAVHPGPDVVDPEEVEALYDTMISSGAWMGVDCDVPVTPDA
jgi:hypothetical protein